MIMELIESVMWVGLGFAPTMALLELISRRRGVIEKLVVEGGRAGKPIMGSKGIVPKTGILESAIEGKEVSKRAEGDVALHV
jgi:hypothetical protein